MIGYFISILFIFVQRWQFTVAVSYHLHLCDCVELTCWQPTLSCCNWRRCFHALLFGDQYRWGSVAAFVCQSRIENDCQHARPSERCVLCVLLSDYWINTRWDWLQSDTEFQHAWVTSRTRKVYYASLVLASRNEHISAGCVGYCRLILAKLSFCDELAS